MSDDSQGSLFDIVKAGKGALRVRMLIEQYTVQGC